ncbi:MAG: hypothetical protein QW594_02310 [Candidatus Woesearchaeota archaeon]
MMNRSKAQAATEYLIILAVVLVIALILLGTFIDIPSLGHSSEIQANAKFWQTAEIGIISHAFINDNTPQPDGILIIKNNFRTRIEITQINISLTPETSVAIYTLPIDLTPGKQQTIQVNSNTNNPCYQQQAGSSYSVGITFKYVDKEIGNTYYYRGAGNKLKGRCAQSLS